LIKNSLRIAGLAWRALMADRELLALPLISGVVAMVLAGSILVPVAVATGGATDRMTWVHYVMLAVLYLALTFVTIFVNASLMLAAAERFDGGDPTVGSALRAAAARTGRILPWALLSATVSVLLSLVRQRGGRGGQVAGAVAGAAWSVVTFLALPVLVFENVGVRDAIRRSTGLIRQAFGENVVARAGLGIVGLLASLPAVVLIALGLALGSTVGLALAGVGVLIVVAVALVLAAMSGVFKAALYRYAVSGQVPGGYFDTEVLSATFGTR
jgi:hypothetical protein